MSYSSYEVDSAPTFLKAPYGAAWNRASGIVKNYYTNLLRQAVQMRFPQMSGPDALGFLGDERGIDQGVDPQRGATESLTAYAARVKAAWDAWALGGSAWGMLKAFDIQGYQPTIVQQSGRTFKLSGGNLVIADLGHRWSFPSPNLWNTFGVFFTAAPSTWTDIHNPPTATSAPSDAVINRLTRIINLWRPAKAICAGLYVLTSGSMWGFGTWGSPRTWGGSVVRFDIPPQTGL